MNRRALGVMCGLLLAGCGQETYERRLAETSALYSHIQVLEDNLGGTFADSNISLRPPKQFRLVAAPKADAEGESEFDPRQPDFVNIELPGLRASFRADLQCGSAGGQDSTQTGYLYLLSNHYLNNTPATTGTAKADEGDDLTGALKKDPSLFTETVMRGFAEALGAQSKQGPKPNEWPKESFPRTVAALFPVGSQNPFVQVSLVSSEMEATIREQPYDVTAYLLAEGQTQVLLLFVIPHDILPAEKMRERIDLSLETLRLVGAAAAVPGPGGVPAAGAGSAGTGQPAGGL